MSKPRTTRKWYVEWKYRNGDRYRSWDSEKSLKDARRVARTDSIISQFTGKRIVEVIEKFHKA